MQRLGFAGWLLWIGLMSFALLTPTPAAEADSGGKAVYWVPVKQEVERGLFRFLERSFEEAEQAGAKAIVLEMDTLGGDVGAALDIGKLIRSSDIPVTVYIKGEAISAGSYIALNADRILLTPGSAMGAAEPRTLDGKTADPKTVAFWASNMRAAAEATDRDPDIAAGMVDRELVIEGVKEKGELISLSAKEAVKQKMAEQIVTNDGEVLKTLHASVSDRVTVELTPSEKLARFVTSPYVIPILFMIGLAGLVIEVFTPGFGIPGAIGLGAFGLYFFGHYLAGFAGAESLVLFAVGLILMLIELFASGFGIFGVLGLISLASSVVIAAQDKVFSLTALVIALLVTGVGLAVAIRTFGARGVWKRFVLKDVQTNQNGYIPRRERRDLVGQRGKTLTPLRPSGSALIDGRRQDVVSEGGFIPAGTAVEVVGVHGIRVVVRPLKEEDDDIISRRN